MQQEIENKKNFEKNISRDSTIKEKNKNIFLSIFDFFK
jgi:hypothetical protein